MFKIYTQYEHDKNKKTTNFGGLAIIWKLQDEALTWVVWKVDKAIHQINHYLAHTVVYFVNTYPPDSDLSGR